MASGNDIKVPSDLGDDVEPILYQKTGTYPLPLDEVLPPITSRTSSRNSLLLTSLLTGEWF